MTPGAFFYASILKPGSTLTVGGAGTPFVTCERLFVSLNLRSKCGRSSCMLKHTLEVSVSST